MWSWETIKTKIKRTLPKPNSPWKLMVGRWNFPLVWPSFQLLCWFFRRILLCWTFLSPKGSWVWCYHIFLLHLVVPEHGKCSAHLLSEALSVTGPRGFPTIWGGWDPPRSPAWNLAQESWFCGIFPNDLQYVCYNWDPTPPKKKLFSAICFQRENVQHCHLGRHHHHHHHHHHQYHQSSSIIIIINIHWTEMLPAIADVGYNFISRSNNSPRSTSCVGTLAIRRPCR